MSLKRNNHRNNRKSGDRGHWVHPTKGLRRVRQDPNPGYATIYSFTARAFIPAKAIKPWGKQKRPNNAS